MVKPRRDRNMDAKRARILAEATRLFDERGFAAVTTQAVSEAADVAAGTLFRYARTKADLLVMVYNVEFGAAVEAGRSAAASLDDPVEAVFALAATVFRRNAEQPENGVAYQRELLFGQGEMLHREEGLRLVAELEEAVAGILLATAGSVDRMTVSEAQRAARLVFGALELALAQPSTHAHPERPTLMELRAQIALVVRGFLATDEQTHLRAPQAPMQGEKIQ